MSGRGEERRGEENICEVKHTAEKHGASETQGMKNKESVIWYGGSKQLQLHSFVTREGARDRDRDREREGFVPEDLEELVDLGVSGEQGALGDHLSQDGAHRPGVHGQGVGLAAQQDLGRAVPQGDHLVGEGADRGHEGARQAEVSQLQAAVSGDQDVLGLQVSVHDATHVAVVQAAQHLGHVGLQRQTPTF
jgi:hypothetical protein